jgi:hypothetical protein
MSGPGLVRGLRAGGRASLMLLGALLPFEMIEPMARVGPLQISSVELFLYPTLAVWGISVCAGWLWGEHDARTWIRRAPAAHRAVLAWALVMLASAACAPALRGPAVKFALRSIGGVLLYAAAADLLRGQALYVARMAKALVAGALVAAILMLAEQRLAVAAGLLHPFHVRSFEVFGLIRASGPFQYPNIAAMYLEAVLPLAFILGARAAGARGQLVAALVILALLDGVLITASRAGLVTAAVVLLGLGAFFVRERQTRRLALAAFAALAVVGLATQLSGSALTLRLAFWKDGAWYRAALSPVAGPAGRLPPVIAPGARAAVSLEVRNLGALPWPSRSATPVALSYHWLDADSGETMVFDGLRTSLPVDVPPGASLTVRATVLAPERSGRYLLWWDLVHEHATWFSERGNPGLRQAVEVREAGEAGAVREAGDLREAWGAGEAGGARGPDRASVARVEGGRYVASDVVLRRDLWRAALSGWREHPLLGLGPDNFRHLYGRYLGLAAADDRLHANSLYFETLAGLGAAGLLALAWILVALASAVRRAVATPETRTLALGLGASLCAYLVHGALDYFFEFTPTYALWWLLGGMVVALGRPPAELPA